jgi:hypothetical protein
LRQGVQPPERVVEVGRCDVAEFPTVSL